MLKEYEDADVSELENSQLDKLSELIEEDAPVHEIEALLSPEQRALFRKSIMQKNGLPDFVQMTEPWWVSLEHMPRIFSSDVSKTSALDLSWNCIAIALAYATVIRSHNMASLEDAAEILKLVPYLTENSTTVLKSPQETLFYVSSRMPDLIVWPNVSRLAKDVQVLVRPRAIAGECPSENMLRVLGDISSCTRKRFTQAKVSFYAAWVSAHGPALEKNTLAMCNYMYSLESI